MKIYKILEKSQKRNGENKKRLLNKIFFIYFVNNLKSYLAFFFFVNLFIQIPTVCTIFVDLLFATFFPNAFPPTVNADTKALNRNCKSKFNPNWFVTFTAIRALIAPLNTPAYISNYVCTYICNSWCIFY